MWHLSTWLGSGRNYPRQSKATSNAESVEMDPILDRAGVDGISPSPSPTPISNKTYVRRLQQQAVGVKRSGPCSAQGSNHRNSQHAYVAIDENRKQYQHSVLDEESCRGVKDGRQHAWQRIFSTLDGWKKGVAVHTVAVICILLINVAFFVGGMALLGKDDVIYSGGCERTGWLSNIAHAVINVLGTFVLASSNYAMQVSAAPTREEVESAHAQKKWIDIGIPSLSNFRHIGFQRALLWMLLATSSIPFHLM